MERRNSLEKCLAVLNAPEEFRVLAGFDGAIDSIEEVVDKRYGTGNGHRSLRLIGEFAERIRQGAGKSTAIEIFTREKRAGGNSVLCANALATLGLDVTLMGCLGQPILPLFEPLKSKMKLISVGAPSLTDALEFEDGKVMLSRPIAMETVNFDRILQQFPEQNLLPLFKSQDLFLFANWTMMPGATEIYRRIADEILPQLQRKSIFYFDFADPQKRSAGDLQQILQILQQFQSFGKVFLSMNLKEGTQILRHLGDEFVLEDDNSKKKALKMLWERHQISGILHGMDAAWSYREGEFVRAPGFFTPQPRISTGGGDNFDAGVIFGYLQGLPFQDCLFLGNALSGYYVREGTAPTRAQLIAFLRHFHP